MFMAHVVYIHHAKNTKLYKTDILPAQLKTQQIHAVFFLQKISTPKISHRVHHVQDRETQDAPGSGHGRFIHHEGS